MLFSEITAYCFCAKHFTELYIQQQNITSKCFGINILTQELEFLQCYLVIIKNDFGIIIFLNDRGEIQFDL